MELRFIVFFALGAAILLIQVPSSKSVIVRLAYDLIRNNLIGTPEFFREQKWEFDPEVGHRREPEYTRRHGVHSEYTIEKLGLGTDGYQELRREEQRIRDKDVTTQLPSKQGYYGGPQGNEASAFGGATGFGGASAYGEDAGYGQTHQEYRRR